MTLPDPHLADRPYLVQGLLELEPGLVLPGGDVRLAESACAAARAPLTSLPEKQSGLFNLAGMSYALPLDGGFDHGRQEVPYHQFRNLRPRRLQAASRALFHGLHRQGTHPNSV
jgi:hypothetical protein